jgi:hypothetical protein
MMQYPEPGRKYRHYKGGLYEVLFLSKHTETNEVLVTYKSLHFGSYYSRPLESWNQKVEMGGIITNTNRFEIVNE